MKYGIVYAILLLGSFMEAHDCKHYQVMIGKKAPDFSAQAMVNGDIQQISLYGLPEGFKILVFYPADFSMVCPTELHGFQEVTEELKKRNTQVIAISTDSIFSHKKWLETPKDEAGIQGIQYPLVADITKEISCNYGVLDPSGVALRAIFIIDQDNIVQVMMVNNLKIGRSVDEVIRLIDAIIFTQQNPGDVCPLNWKQGQDAMHATPEGAKEYMAKH